MRCYVLLCIFAASLLSVTGLLFASGTEPVEEISDEQFDRLHSELVRPSELWLTIPWQTDLLAAQRLASSENKPIFIWAMDGHPLGCT